MEILKTPCDTRVYLNLMICPAEPDNSCDQSITFDFQIQGSSYRGRAFIFAGGQRLLLDQAATERIVTALYSGEQVTISMGMYRNIDFPPFSETSEHLDSRRFCERAPQQT